MEALAMGNYGAYVWTAYSLTLVVVLINEWRVRARQSTVYRDIKVRIKALEENE